MNKSKEGRNQNVHVKDRRQPNKENCAEIQQKVRIYINKEMINYGNTVWTFD